MIAVDTNVLIYAHRGEAELNEIALARLSGLCEGTQPWALPVPCISEFFRVVTHPRVFNPPSTLTDAIAFAESLLGAPTCRLLRPGSDFTEYLFDAMSGSDARGNLVFDAQIVALCREHGISDVLTNDRDFERFDGLNIEYLGFH